MPYVIAQPCFGCKYGDCVEVCPVNCIYFADEIAYIHPDECIDCGACEPECPVDAIFPDHDIPAAWGKFIQIAHEQANRGGAVSGKAEKQRREMERKQRMDTSPHDDDS